MMNRNHIPKPTDAELEILSVLWEHGPSTVRFVNDQLNERREVGYTTTLKFLQIMSEKGLVTRNAEGRTHIYEAVSNREQVQEQRLRRISLAERFLLFYGPVPLQNSTVVLCSTTMLS